MLSPCWDSRTETERIKAVQGVGKGEKDTGSVSEPIGDVGPKEGCAVSPDKCRDEIRWLEGERRRRGFRRGSALDGWDVSSVPSLCHL